MTTPATMKVKDPMKVDANGHEPKTDCCWVWCGRKVKIKPQSTEDIPKSRRVDWSKIKGAKS
jgi:hypothetical protein